MNYTNGKNIGASNKQITFIDLFAGIGGTRIGFEEACKNLGFKSKCVFTSEIKEHAIKAYRENFSTDKIHGDITQIDAKFIPDFDILLAGFPCQAFSSAGKRNGFADTRGTLFFEIERILEQKKPKGFLLENVEGLVNHDKKNASDEKGQTFSVILTTLESIGYKVSWKIIDASHHGVPQKRKRVYIAGTLRSEVDLSSLSKKQSTLDDILEKNQKLLDTDFTKLLLRHFTPKELFDKSIKDKRGGMNNIHSWDIELKGHTTKVQRKLLNELLKERRKKHWAIKKGIKWMDGMPLALDEIYSFFKDLPRSELKKELDDLVRKKYVKFEYPKDIVEDIPLIGQGVKKRRYSTDKEPGYNIVAGKLSFPLSKILDPHKHAPTLVATDVDKLAVIDGDGIRKLTIREGLRLFGFPEDYKLDLAYLDAFDLLGNTVVVKMIEMISVRLLQTL